MLVSTSMISADGCNSGGCGTVSATTSDCGGCNSSCGSSSDCNACVTCNTCSSTQLLRSVGDNLARERSMQQYFFFDFDNDCFRGAFNVAYEFQETFRLGRNSPVQNLLGTHSCNNAKFVGSEAVTTGTRGSRDILADNFGISPFASTTVAFHPKIKNQIVDFQAFFGLDEWWNGLYFRAYVPFAHSSWKFLGGAVTTGTCISSCNSSCGNSSCGSNSSCGNSSCGTSSCGSSCNSSSDCFSTSTLVTTPFPAGAVKVISAGTQAAASSVQQALSGDFLFGDMQTPWNFGRFSPCSLSRNKVADVDMLLGWNFWNCDNYHVGAYFKAVAPTGTRFDSRHAKNIFAPTIGDDHWKVGGGLTGVFDVWNCEDHSLTVYLEGYATHLIKRCQVRSFDFRNNGCFSRYSLLKQFNTDGTYANNLINAINFNTRRADVSVSVQGEALVELLYQNTCGWSTGLGYNFYGRAHEKICSIKSGTLCGQTNLDTLNWGIKGCAPVQAPTYTVTSGVVTAGPVTPAVYAATESTATAYACGPVDNATLLSTPTSVSVVPGTTVVLNTTTVAALSAAGDIVYDSRVNGVETPALVTIANLDPQSAASDRIITHKVYAHVDYAWMDCDWTPYLGVGGEAEFAQRKESASLSQWGVWIKGGITF